MNPYPHLFSRLTIKNVTFRNRIFAAPCSMTPSRDGGVMHSPDEKQILYFENKARGGAAAVTVAETCVSLKYAPRKLNVGNVALMPPGRSGHRDYIKEAAQIARHGAVPSIQLFHAGDVTHPMFLEGRNPIGPNDYVRADGVHVIGMDEALMEETCKEFADAALFMKNCGFKMVMIHGGHGWLISQFLSPATNWRKDEYGGSIENRARFPLRILKAVREAVGDDFLVELRISGDEHMENGITLEDVCAFAQMAEKYIDIIHISAGSYYTTNQYTFPSIFLPRGCNLELAKAVKKVVKIPVATVGGYNNPEEMDRIIRDGDADIIYMARQLIADPETPNKWRTGRNDEVVPCTRCMNCLGRFDTGVMGCDVNPSVGHELYNLNLMLPPQHSRKVVVVGGGPGGLSAAYTAWERGHKVTLLEKESRLGGTLNYLEHDCHKGDLLAYRDHMIKKVMSCGIDVRLNTEATVELLNSLAPDVVLCAVGAEPIVPPIPGLKEHSMTAKQLHYYEGKIGERVVIIGGGLSGCEMGLSYARQGHRVTVVEMGPKIAPQANHIHRPAILEVMEELSDNIRCLVNTKCVKVEPNGIEVEDKDGRHFIEADTIINALGMRPRYELVEQLAKCNAPFFEAFGDCSELAQVRGAVHGGYYRAMNIR